MVDITITNVKCDLERGSGLLPRVLLLDVSESNPHLVDALGHQVDQGAVQLPIQALVYWGCFTSILTAIITTMIILIKKAVAIMIKLTTAKSAPASLQTFLAADQLSSVLSSFMHLFPVTCSVTH